MPVCRHTLRNVRTRECTPLVGVTLQNDADSSKGVVAPAVNAPCEAKPRVPHTYRNLAAHKCSIAAHTHGARINATADAAVTSGNEATSKEKTKTRANN